MPLFRAFLLWAVMFAVPFQGYAAASMALCASEQSGPVAAATAAPHASAHAHDAHPHAVATPGAGHDDPDHAASQGDSAHKCGTCGACHSVALTPTPLFVAPDFLPPAELAAPLLTVAFRAPRVPDKPPRA